MSFSKHSGWGSKGSRKKMGPSQGKGSPVVRGGLPTIGSVPITYGQSARIRSRKPLRGMGPTGSLGSLQPQFKQKKSRGAVLARLAAVVVVLLVLFLAVKVIVPDEQPVDEPVETSSGATPKAALASAVEEVDANGIVRGVTADGVSYVVYGRGQETAEPGKVTLVAVGDQIGTTQALALADAYGGSVDDGVYDFWPFYREIASVISSFDIAYVNQETIMAGNQRYGYSGYPTFNTPAAAAEALDDVGFDVVGFGSNHVYDLGEYGAQETHKVWDGYSDLLVAGSYASQEERDTVQLIERGGATIAVLQYCYGDNYLGTYENFPNAYHLTGFDKDAIRADVERAKSVANAVVVGMHWGTEYDSDINAQQEEYAKYLADLGVDLVLGTHAHITQPIKYVTGESGNTVPVVYGMSDIVSGWDKIDCILSGLFTCEFTFSGENAQVSALAWHPTIEWSDGGDTYVRLLADMDAQTVNANVRVADCDDDYAYITQTLADLGMEVPVVWEAGYLRSLANGDAPYVLRNVVSAVARITSSADVYLPR